MTEAALILTAAHLLYYAYFFIGDYIIKMARSRNLPPSMTVLRLMEEYKVDVRMFNYNGSPYGFAWFRTIWLNTRLESLRKKGKASPDWMLKAAFYHELYHIRNNHKKWTLLLRFTFAFTPMVLMIDWVVFIPVYILYAYALHYVNEVFEENANSYAKEMMNEPKVIKSEGNN